MSDTYYIRAYRKTDFALIEEEQQSEWMAYRSARYHYANGYSVKVTRISRECIADWTRGDKIDD